VCCALCAIRGDPRQTPLKIGTLHFDPENFRGFFEILRSRETEEACFNTNE
jgi:hypothetical protein